MTAYNLIWAIDPGSVATGIAMAHSEILGYTQAEQFTSMPDAWHFLERQWRQQDVILIEMYRSAGHLNQHAQRTIEVVGFFKHAIEVFFDTTPLIVAEQARLSGQREAAGRMNGSIDTLRMDPSRKDAFSALSHACAYRRRISNG